MNVLFTCSSWPSSSPFRSAASSIWLGRSEDRGHRGLAVWIDAAASGGPFGVSTCFWMSARASQAWVFAFLGDESPPHADATTQWSTGGIEGEEST